MSTAAAKAILIASDEGPAELTIGTGEHSLKLTRQEVGGVMIYAEPGFEHATTPLEPAVQWWQVWRKLK